MQAIDSTKVGHGGCDGGHMGTADGWMLTYLFPLSPQTNGKLPFLFAVCGGDGDDGVDRT
jgi:hypothetical protein